MRLRLFASLIALAAGTAAAVIAITVIHTVL